MVFEPRMTQGLVLQAGRQLVLRRLRQVVAGVRIVLAPLAIAVALVLITLIPLAPIAIAIALILITLIASALIVIALVLVVTALVCLAVVAAERFGVARSGTAAAFA